MTHPTRREFCTQACQIASAATLAGTLGTLLQACAGGGGNTVTGGSLPRDVPALPTVGATSAGGGVTLTIDAGSPLASVGGAALVQSPSGLLLVARTGPEAFTALSATCTHENCTIIGFTGQDYVCPCHGSRFSTSGAVENGPATRPLRSFPARFANDVLTISA
jgi:cytochrome b6-f complex iron-sulfur subunit